MTFKDSAGGGDFIDARANQFYVVASAALFYYDLILTSQSEIKHIWRKKLNLVSVLVIAMRYLSALDYAVVMYLALRPFNNDCSALVRIPGIIGVVCQAIIAALLIIRTYAIYEKSLRILLLLVLVGVPSVVFSMNALIGTDTLHAQISDAVWGNNSAPVTLLPNLTCFLVPSLHDRHQSLSRYEKSFIVTIAFDTLIFLLAFARMIQSYKFSRSSFLKPTFSMILLRDGCILFAALLVSHVNNLAFFESSWNNFDGTPSALRNPFNHVVVVSSGTNCELTHAISVVLVSRMVFNLREIGTEVYEGTQEFQTRLGRSLRDMEFRAPTSIGGSTPDDHIHNEMSGVE